MAKGAYNQCQSAGHHNFLRRNCGISMATNHYTEVGACVTVHKMKKGTKKMYKIQSKVSSMHLLVVMLFFFVQVQVAQLYCTQQRIRITSLRLRAAQCRRKLQH
mmetsp:Transcript_56584/g.109232  ORF Transcript_56584/g.109232 Transcript_56584/m.109232 type:complete len:104 (-) Transcript_56584:669-980(-)